MSKKILARTENLTKEEWLKLRKQGIGGSDAATACGLSRYESRLGLWMDKTSEELQDKDNEAMYWGRTLEPVIRQEFSARTGKAVEEMPYIFQSAEYPFMIADIDGIIREDDGSVSLVEIKTVSAFKACEWENGLPIEYYIQVQHYLSVCGLSKAYVVYLVGGNSLSWQEIQRDDEMINTIVALEADFWNFVQRKEQPPTDANAGEALAHLYPASKKVSTLLPDEADSIITEYMEIKAIEDDVKAKKNELENQLKAMLKESECGLSKHGYSVSWKSSTTSRLDTTKLKSEKPEIVAQYSVKSSSRRFSVTKTKASKNEPQAEKAQPASKSPKTSKPKAAAPKKLTASEREKIVINYLLDRYAEEILESHVDPDFVEVIYKIGGDVCRVRVYDLDGKDENGDFKVYAK